MPIIAAGMFLLVAIPFFGFLLHKDKPKVDCHQELQNEPTKCDEQK